ncbi:hypothetical protein ACFL59_06875 [Planctomycetota bacterium]
MNVTSTLASPQSARARHRLQPYVLPLNLALAIPFLLVTGCSLFRAELGIGLGLGATVKVSGLYHGGLELSACRSYGWRYGTGRPWSANASLPLLFHWNDLSRAPCCGLLPALSREGQDTGWRHCYDLEVGLSFAVIQIRIGLSPLGLLPPEKPRDERLSDPSELGEEIARTRGRGTVVYGVIESRGESIGSVLEAFRLEVPPDRFMEVDESVARAFIERILRWDLRHGTELMQQRTASELAHWGLWHFHDQSARTYTNVPDPTSEARSTGIVIIGDQRSGCLWIDEVD